MAQVDSRTLLMILLAIVVVSVVYYLNTNNKQPETFVPVHPPMIDNRMIKDVSNSLVDDLIAQYTVEDRPMDGGAGTFKGIDHMESDKGPFDDYGQKRQINLKLIDEAYPDSCNSDSRDFSYKKKKYTRRTPEDVKELFNVQKMLPQEVNEDWFDVEPLMTTKKIRGTHLIHPKVHMGVNTVGTSLRNGTHDLRGDVPNPKINASPWNNSTIEPDTNLKGICSSI